MPPQSYPPMRFLSVSLITKKKIVDFRGDPFVLAPIPYITHLNTITIDSHPCKRKHKHTKKMGFCCNGCVVLLAIVVGIIYTQQELLNQVSEELTAYGAKVACSIGTSYPLYIPVLCTPMHR